MCQDLGHKATNDIDWVQTKMIDSCLLLILIEPDPILPIWKRILETAAVLSPHTVSRCYNECPVIMIFLEFYFAGLQALEGASWAQSRPTLAAWKHFLCNGFIFNIHIKYSFMLNNQNIVSVYIIYPGSQNKYIVNLSYPYPGPIPFLCKPHSISSLLETHSTENTMSRAPSRLMER